MNKKLAVKTKYSQKSEVFNYVLILFSFIFIVLFTTFKVSGDDDVFWHLETGKYIVETKTVPSADVFGYMTAGQQWIPFEWGWDIITYFIYSISGFNGLSVFRTLIFLAIFSIYIRLIRKLELNIPLSLLLFTVLMFGMIDRLIVKPQIISYLFFSILLYILISFQTFNRQKTKVLFVIPFIFLFWCNMHMGVIAASVILIVFFMTELVCYLKPQLFSNVLTSIDKKQMAKLAAITLISLTLMLVNPFGLNTYVYVYEHLNMKMLEDVFEWYSPFNKVYTGTMFQYIYYFFLICLIFVVYGSFKKRNYFFTITAAILGIISFSSARYALDFMLVLCFLTPTAIGAGSSFPAFGKLWEFFETKAIAYGSIIILFLSIVSIPGNSLYKFLKYSRTFGFGIDKRDNPVSMIEFIKTHNIQNIGSRPFNSFNMGGYFIHELGGTRNFIDSRNLYDEIYYKYKTVNNKMPGFENTIDEAGFDYFAWFYPGLANNSIEVKTSIVSYLIDNNNDWKLVYWDDNSFLFLKNEKKFADLIAKFEYKYVNPYYYIYEREPLKKSLSEHSQEVVKEIQRKYKDEPDGNFINSIAKTFRVPVSR